MPWLAEYEAFHKAQRGQPGAKYLLHVSGTLSGGFGDRMRAMMYTIRAAAAGKRIALFQWDTPHALTKFFLPASGIDWRVDGLDLSNATLIDMKPAYDVFGYGRLGGMEDRVISIKVGDYCPKHALCRC